MLILYYIIQIKIETFNRYLIETLMDFNFNLRKHIETNLLNIPVIYLYVLSL